MLEFISSVMGSNWIVAIATVVAVFVGFDIQKQEEKKNAATIVLMEIRDAENSIEELKNSDLKTVNFNEVAVLPINSWSKFNHLFVKNLDRDELDFLNDFYKKCFLTENAIKALQENFSIAIQEKAKTIYPKLLVLAEKHSNKTFEENRKGDSAYSKEKQAILDTYYRDSESFVPDAPRENLRKYITTIRFITNSPLGEKLKQMAGMRTNK